MGRAARHAGDDGRLTMSYPNNRDDHHSLETRLVHAATGAGGRLPAESVAPAIQKGSTVLLPNAASLYDHSIPNYGRQGLAAQKALAEAMCDLEGAKFCQLYGSGLAAVTGALMSILHSGDTILVTDGVYHPVRRFCGEFLNRFGVETIYYPADASPSEIMALATTSTRLIFIESPASLTFEMVDVAAVVQMARARGILTMADNTWGAGLSFRPLEHGVDLSMQALTKYVCGHSDVFLGSVCTNNPQVEAALKLAMIIAGFSVSAEDAYQGLRGLRTLPLRFARHGESGLIVARWLQQRPEVARVLHPALPGDPGHDIWSRDYKGACGLLGVELVDMPQHHVERILNCLKLFGLGFSWGGFESLAIVSKPTRTAKPWAGGPLIRLNIGLETPEDLISDLQQAFEVAGSA